MADLMMHLVSTLIGLLAVPGSCQSIVGLDFPDIVSTFRSLTNLDHFQD